MPIVFQVHGRFDANQSMSRWRQRCSVTRCCYNRRAEGRARAGKNYYELLGVSVDSNAQEIKEAYRKLQKKYHPDIAGQKGHEHTLLLNEAYKVLMRDDLRRDYDAFVGHQEECTHYASNTFEMNEALGCARVKVQYGDDDQNIERRIGSIGVPDSASAERRVWCIWRRLGKTGKCFHGSQLLQQAVETAGWHSKKCTGDC
ncbi:hypothetical protein CIPAW_02G035300 [Carya illinoinensis]|uniref:J domain-containing protein n=1 Tax=Carya illinoinensis TaxID=32201 RepID=A0A8T1RBW6_CARIL|nr:hypothetical protein CIPAW_02G035300 [Carya illinoinensis]